jgi:hypothetical protein
MNAQRSLPPHTRSVDTHSQTAGRRGWDVGNDERVVWSGSGRGVWEWVEEWARWTCWWARGPRHPVFADMSKWAWRMGMAWSKSLSDTGTI